MTLDEYLTLMSDEYFSICQNKSVIEIGPNDGIHTKLIVNHSPKYLELIEPDTKNSEKLASIKAQEAGYKKIMEICSKTTSGEILFFAKSNLHALLFVES